MDLHLCPSPQAAYKTQPKISETVLTQGRRP